MSLKKTYLKILSTILLILMASLIPCTLSNPPDLIKIDGFFTDWNHIPVFISDPMNDPGLIIPPEDISTCKITRARIADNTNPVPVDRIFFNYNHFHNPMLDYAMVYSIWLDTIPGEGDPTMGGTDYIISFGLHVVEPAGFWVSLDEVPLLNKYNKSSGSFDFIQCEGLDAAYGEGPDSGLSLEFSVPAECVGSPGCFNVFFLTFTIGGPGSDYAPDMVDSQVSFKRYCAPSPVGGKLVYTPTNSYVAFILVSISIILISIQLIKKNIILSPRN